jgi:cyanophycinase
VFFADVTNTVVVPSQNTFYTGVSAHYLTQDDSIDLTTGKKISNFKRLKFYFTIMFYTIGSITFASWKSPLKGNEYYMNAEVSTDILSATLTRRWANVADQFFDNRRDDSVAHLSFERNPRFEIVFDRLSAAGYGGYLPSDSNKFAVSYENLKVAIHESN